MVHHLLNCVFLLKLLREPLLHFVVLLMMLVDLRLSMNRGILLVVVVGCFLLEIELAFDTLLLIGVLLHNLVVKFLQLLLGCLLRQILLLVSLLNLRGNLLLQLVIDQF